jgi:hypothetical protein
MRQIVCVLGQVAVLCKSCRHHATCHGLHHRADVQKMIHTTTVGFEQWRTGCD